MSAGALAKAELPYTLSRGDPLAPLRSRGSLRFARSLVGTADDFAPPDSPAHSLAAFIVLAQFNLFLAVAPIQSHQNNDLILTFASWNQIGDWRSRLDAFRSVA
jgi:hypothetical protein